MLACVLDIAPLRYRHEEINNMALLRILHEWVCS